MVSDTYFHPFSHFNRLEMGFIIFQGLVIWIGLSAWSQELAPPAEYLS